jgi:hypothetical protein
MPIRSILNGIACDPFWRICVLWYTCASSRQGGSAVDLSLKMNVLAVCAVFVFVGAILLGAF